MKNFSFLVFIFFIFNFSKAQEISVTATKMNVAFIGIYNPITIMVNGIDCSELTVEVENGKLIKKPACKYLYMPAKQGEALFSVYKDSILVGTYEFRIKRIPDPIVTLGGKLQGGHIRKGTLAAQTGIIALLRNFNYDLRFTILEYDFVLCSENVYFTEHQVGPILTKNMKKVLLESEGKTKVLFTNIVAKGPGNLIRNLSGIRFDIIDYKQKKDTFECEKRYYPLEINQTISNDTIFTEFNCGCKKFLKIETDKMTIKGLNNDYHTSYKTTIQDSVIINYTFNPYGTLASKEIIKYLTTTVKCPNNNNKKVEYSGYFNDSYFEWYDNGNKKLEGYYKLKERINKIDKDVHSIGGCGSFWKCNTKEAKRDGYWKYYNEDEVLIKKDKYKLGKLVSTKKFN